MGFVDFWALNWGVCVAFGVFICRGEGLGLHLFFFKLLLTRRILLLSEEVEASIFWGDSLGAPLLGSSPLRGGATGESEVAVTVA